MILFQGPVSFENGDRRPIAEVGQIVGKILKNNLIGIYTVLANQIQEASSFR